MKQSLKLIAYYVIAILVFISCKKPPLNSISSTPGNPTPPPVNRLPVASARPDTTIYYDLQTCKIDEVNLDGRNSTDLDGRIISYWWTGPGLISKRDSAVTSVRLLSTGQHQFTLSVTDDKGGSDWDTMIVNVVSRMNRPTMDVQLIPFGTLSEARAGIAAGSAGNKIVFAGAASNSGQTDPSTRVDIYDINTNSWSVAELSAARQDFSVVTSGNKIFFAGGWEGNWWEYPLMFTNVDIYDAATDSWSVKHLSEPRAWVGSASAGNKVFFAGGTNNILLASSKVDIYDTETNTWSTTSLSEPRSNISTQIAGDKIFFAGGSNGFGWVPRATVNVYDINTSLWSVSSMNEPKSNMKSFATGSKILWAGGASINKQVNYTSGIVEIRDLITQNSSFACLHEPRGWDNDQKAAVKNNQVIFFTGYPATNKFDIYDIVNNSWSIGILNQDIVGAA